METQRLAEKNQRGKTNTRHAANGAEDNLNGFRTHGVTFSGNTGSQLRGDCPFCGKEGHFYANKENKLWDCKRCGEDGNFEDFLEGICKVRAEGLSEQRLGELAANRGIPVSAFRGLGIGFDGDRYTVPIRNSKGRVVDVRLFRLGGKFLSTPTASTGLFNCQEMVSKEGLGLPVQLCEGEWDTIAWRWLLARAGVDAVCVGVPGAGTFKENWISLFQDREVDVLYDNDAAGEAGCRKVLERLQGTASKLRFLRWDGGGKQEFPEGYDLRDIVKELGVKQGKPKKCYMDVQRMLQSEEVITGGKEGGKADSVGGGMGEGASGVAGDDRRGILELITVDELMGEYKKWLHMSSLDPLKVMYGTVLANKLGGDPLWMFLVAPPGGSKSELLMSIAGGAGVHALSSLTPHTLISGASWGGGGDPSLLPKLEGKILIVKDFTTILTMHYAVRDEIFGVLRDVYDGHTEKVFGNGVRRKYSVRFGILAGVTPTIETFNVMHQSLGERFLKFRIGGNWDQDSEEDKILRALNNIGKENRMREELQKAGSRFMAHVKIPEVGDLPQMDDAMKLKIVHLAKFSARLRGVVERDKYTSSVLYKPSSEVGTRIAKQLAKLGQGIGLFLGKTRLDDEIYRLILRVALDTVPDRVEDIIHSMWKLVGGGGGMLSTAELVKDTRLPQATVFRVLQDLNLLRIVECRVDGGKSQWGLGTKVTEHIKKGGIYK